MAESSLMVKVDLSMSPISLESVEPIGSERGCDLERRGGQNALPSCCAADPPPGGCGVGRWKRTGTLRWLSNRKVPSVHSDKYTLYPGSVEPIGSERGCDRERCGGQNALPSCRAADPSQRGGEVAQRVGLGFGWALRYTIWFLVLNAIVLLTPQSASAQVSSTGLETATPESVGMRSDRLQRIDRIVEQGLARKNMPGAVVLIARKGKVVFHKAYGSRQLKPAVEPMTADTVFDMASITKPVVTATCVMKLIEDGKLQLHERVSKYIPDFGANGKQDITLYQLLTHQGGLIPDNALKDYVDGREKAFERINALKTYVKPGSKFVYTDVGFILLARIVEKVSGMNVHEYSKTHLFSPLGMNETGYLPAKGLRQRCATTQTRTDDAGNEYWLKGEVHDPRAFELGGIAGHAGLFSTAKDLAVYGQMLIQGGQYQGVRILRPETVATMTSAYSVSSGYRGLGWDKRTGFSSNRGDLLSDAAFGHGGFTGTVLWMDPDNELIFVFLSNRVHPDGKGSVNALAGRIATVAAAAISEDVSGNSDTNGFTQAQTGLESLVSSKFEAINAGRIGLITNQTGINNNGQSNVKLFREASEVNLVALFSPEHGFAGELDTSIIADTVDGESGLKIFSLYGETRTPTAEMLRDVDTLVFDIQDIGTRFYTYISTMGNAMKAAAKHGKRFVVLDRPNPIGGSRVSGPVLDPGSESFVGYHPIAVRHGMTVGELALMLNDELKLNLDLEIVRCHQWKRGQYFDQTNLRWKNPSPNMRSLTQAVLYPGVGLLETTNVSVGRGTDTPFEVLGAPWIDERTFCQTLNSFGLKGVRFIPIRFTPQASKFKGESCGGVNIVITNRAISKPVRIGIVIACQLQKLYPDKWDTRSLNRLLSNERAKAGIVGGKDWREIEVDWQADLEEFKQRRLKYLLYK